MALKAIIFDLDGVIVDTAELHYSAWKRLADEEGAPFNKEINESFKGVSRQACVRILFPNVESEERLAFLAEKKNSYYVDMIENLKPENLLPGVYNFIREVKRENIRTGIGSVSKNTRKVLEKLQVTDMFDAVVDGTLIKNSKPAPDVFILCAKLLEVDPKYCIVIEDAEAGIEAAHAAGIIAIGRGSAYVLRNADYVVESIEELNLDKLKALLLLEALKRAE